MKTFGFSQGHREKVASMRISPIVLLLFAMLGCGSGSEPAKTPAESGGNQTQSPKTVTTDVNSIGMLLVPIPAGTFTMGDANGADNETPHQVTLTQPFHLGQYEVTQEQYEKVMGKNPSYFRGGQNPVQDVSWNDAVEFCRKLSALPAEKKAGYVYRLPTEAEWEYACRAGTKTTYSFGDSESELSDYAWRYENSGKTTHPVGGKKPNGWGLYDMHGNVFELCQDYYGNDYYGNSPVADPRGPTSGCCRVVRGGSWGNFAQDSRSAYRDFSPADRRHYYDGFRVVCEWE